MSSHVDQPQPVPPLAAPLAFTYPQFERTSVPQGCNAVDAWIGNIQPFASDEDARRFFLRVERGQPVSVEAGTLIVPAAFGQHIFLSYLQDMAQTCRLLILEPAAPAHPRSYLLSPLYDLDQSALHPHPRGDQLITYQGSTLPGMCIYSAAEHKFSNEGRLVQYLDLVTLHVARHLIWLKTRVLERCDKDGKRYYVRPCRAGEKIPRDAHKRGDLWVGHWPGRRARATNAKEHVATINPEHECWCGSGTTYSECHLNKEAGGPDTAFNMRVPHS